MPSNLTHKEGRIIDLVEQMRREAGAVHSPPDRANRPFDIAQQAHDEVEQAERRLEASEQASKQLSEQPYEQPHRTRWGPDEPESSGDEDNRGRRKKTYIKLVEKKALVEPAANICHTDLNRRKKDEFWRILVRKRQLAGGPSHNWNTVKSFFHKEMRERRTEVAEDDTSGKEIRQSDYYSHLDILIERDNIISKPFERRTQTLEQLAAKERTRVNLHRHLGEKRRAGEVFDGDEDEDTASQYIDTEGGEGGTEEGSTSSTQS